ncbi:MAG: MFS transporter [Nitrospirae bacterium]|nr:MFS transporter [Nitrospirota bacterium]
MDDNKAVSAVRWPELEGLGLTEERKLAYNRFRFWRIVIACSIWYSFYYLGRLNWGICMPWAIKDLNITKMEAGIVATGLLWSYAIGAFLAGRWGDRFGPRIMQTIGGIGSTILNIITGLQSTLTGIFIPYTVNGFVQGQVYAPTNMLISQWYPKARRGFATGIFGTAMGISSLVAWAVTGFTVAQYGWRAAFIWPLLIFTLPTTIALRFLVKNKPEDAGFPAYKELMEKSLAAKAENLKDEEIKGVKAWLILFKSWKFLCLCVASFSANIGRYGLLTWVPLFYAETAGIKLSHVPAMTFALPLGMMFGPITAGLISDKVFHAKRFQMICTYFIGCIVVLLLMAFIPIKEMGLPWAIALQVLAGLFVLGITGALFTAACDFGGRRMAGTAVGTINFFNYFGAGIQGLLIGGLLTASKGNWTVVFATIAGMMALGTFLTFLTKE